MSLQVVQPVTVTNPDQGGTLAVTGAVATGHGATVTSVNVSPPVGSDSQSQAKSCRWSGIPNPAGNRAAVALKFSWNASGAATASPAGGGGSASANASFVIEYSLNGGGAWTTHASDVAGSSGGSDPLSSSGSANIPLSISQDLSQVQVRTRTDVSATVTVGGVGGDSADANITSSVSGIQVEVTSIDGGVIFIH